MRNASLSLGESGRRYMPGQSGYPIIECNRITTETTHASLSRILEQQDSDSQVRYWLDQIWDFDKPGRQSIVPGVVWGR